MEQLRSFSPEHLVEEGDRSETWGELITVAMLGLGIMILLLAAVMVAYGFYLRRSQRRLLDGVRRVVAQSADNQFRQFEALVAVRADLDLKASLPPTRAWAASPDFLREIALHTLQARPNIVVECGSGVSTVILARCVQLNGCGRVFSLEHLPEFAESTKRELRRHGLEEFATVVHAPLRSHELRGEMLPWYALDELPKIEVDMLVVDGPPAEISELARYPAALLFDRLTPGGPVFLDDANRREEKATVERWSREFARFRPERRDCEKGCAVLWKL